MSEGKKGQQPKLNCPYCNLTGGSSNMKRYHFNNCKQRKKEVSV